MKWFYISRSSLKTPVLLENIEDISSPKGAFISCKAKKKDWGVLEISRHGEIEWKIPPLYENVNSFSEGLLPFSEQDKWGFINEQGQVFLAPIWDYVFPFSEGLAIAFQGEKRGVINKKGQYIIPPKADDLRSYSQGISVGRVAGTWFLLDVNGKTLSTPSVAFLHSFHENFAAANLGGRLIQGQLVMGGQWGFVDQKGDFTIKPQFSWLGSFSDHYAPYYIEERDEWGLVSTEGVCKAISGVSGIRSVYGEEMIVEKEGLWGVMSHLYEEIIPFAYDDIQYFGDRGYLAAQEE